MSALGQAASIPVAAYNSNGIIRNPIATETFLFTQSTSGVYFSGFFRSNIHMHTSSQLLRAAHVQVFSPKNHLKVSFIISIESCQHFLDSTYAFQLSNQPVSVSSLHWFRGSQLFLIIPEYAHDKQWTRKKCCLSNFTSHAECEMWNQHANTRRKEQKDEILFLPIFVLSIIIIFGFG